MGRLETAKTYIFHYSWIEEKGCKHIVEGGRGLKSVFWFSDINK